MRLAAGSMVSVPRKGEVWDGVIVEDRGALAPNGEHLFRVRLEGTEDPLEFEVPASMVVPRTQLGEPR
jgi:hypothetical protein